MSHYGAALILYEVSLDMLKEVFGPDKLLVATT